MNADLAFVLNIVCCSENPVKAISLKTDRDISLRKTASLGLVSDAANINRITVEGTVLVSSDRNVDEIFQWMIKTSGSGDFAVL